MTCLPVPKQKTRSREHFYRSLLEEVPSSVLAWDASGEIITANSAAFSLLKCSHLYTEMQLAVLVTTGIRDSAAYPEKR